MIDWLYMIAFVSWHLGFVAAVAFFDELPSDTPQARTAVAVLLFVFAPIVLPALLIAGAGLGVRYVAIGFRDLYRQLVPRRAKLPVAKVRR